MNEQELKYFLEEWYREKEKGTLTRLKEEFMSEMREMVIGLIAKFIDLPLTIKQVSILIGVNEEALYKWEKYNLIKFNRVGKRVFISLKELNECLLKRKCSKQVK